MRWKNQSKIFFFRSGPQKINFNCTTDSYDKPSIYECTKCKVIFSELIFKMDQDQIEKNYQNVAG